MRLRIAALHLLVLWAFAVAIGAGPEIVHVKRIRRLHQLLGRNFLSRNKPDC